jgi:hypothetical protein
MSLGACVGSKNTATRLDDSRSHIILALTILEVGRD